MSVWVAQDGAWRGPGGAVVPFNTSEPTFDWTDAAPPWALQTGESLLDNIPAGVPVVNSQDFSDSTDVYTLLTAIDSEVSEPVYVQLEAKTYTVSTMRTYGGTQYLGYANSNRRVMGLIGHGATQTHIQVAPTAVSSNASAMSTVLNATGSGGPIQVNALYFSNTQTDVPMFFSGINFQGTLQTPFSTYSTASQAHFRKNHAVASPLAWAGIALWRAVEGSRMQFCRYQGFAYALNTAPPFESGAISSNYCEGMVVERTELDGRLAASVDPTRPVASGGCMWNKEQDIILRDFWLHHTRRSGWATNTNTNDQGEVYKGTRVKCNRIADTDDQYAGDNGYFNGSNVEEVIGVFEYEDMYFNISGGAHINWAVPYSNVTGVVPIPEHEVIKVRGFHSDDALYGGCLRISVLRNPNSTGESRIWQHLNTNGIVDSGFFDIRDHEGNPLTGVRHSEWNLTMTPDTHYVVTY